MWLATGHKECPSRERLGRTAGDNPGTFYLYIQIHWLGCSYDTYP